MGLQVWLPLNGNLNNYGLCNYQLSMFRGSEVYNDNGKIGKCFHANGVNTIKILNIMPDFYNYNGYSLCAWFYIEAQNTSHSGCGIISAGNWNSQVLNLSLSDWSTNHYTRLRISGTNWSRTYLYNFSLNTWYHVVVSSDNNKTYAYVNGILIGNTEDSFLPTSIEGNDICIGGATYYSGMQFFGRINDVRIYDYCLSDKEVEELSKGLILHYKLDDAYVESTTNLCTVARPGTGTDVTWGGHVTQWTVYNTTSNDPVPFSEGIKGEVVYGQNGATGGGASRSIVAVAALPSTTYTYSCYIKTSDNFNYTHANFLYRYEYTALSGGTKVTEGGYYNTQRKEELGNGWYRIWGTFTTQSTTNAINISFFTYPSKDVTYWVGGWQLEQKDHMTPFAAPGSTRNSLVYDSSGYQNNGTIVGQIEIFDTTPRYSHSTYINSSDPTTNNTTGEYYISADCGLTTPSTISVSWWASPESGYGGGISHAMWSTTANDIASDYQTSAFNHRDTKFDVNSSDGQHLALSTASFTANAWHHYVVTYDGQTAKLYKDSVQQTSVAFSAAKTLGTFTKVLIGHSRAGGVHRKMKGKYSDFRIYATALTDKQIKELYDTSATIDNLGNTYARELVE